MHASIGRESVHYIASEGDRATDDASKVRKNRVDRGAQQGASMRRAALQQEGAQGAGSGGRQYTNFCGRKAGAALHVQGGAGLLDARVLFSREQG